MTLSRGSLYVAHYLAFIIFRCWAALFGILMPQGKGLGNTKPMLRNKRGAATKEIQKGEIMRGRSMES